MVSVEIRWNNPSKKVNQHNSPMSKKPFTSSVIVIVSPIRRARPRTASRNHGHNRGTTNADVRRRTIAAKRGSCPDASKCNPPNLGDKPASISRCCICGSAPRGAPRALPHRESRLGRSRPSAGAPSNASFCATPFQVALALVALAIAGKRAVGGQCQGRHSGTINAVDAAAVARIAHHHATEHCAQKSQRRDFHANRTSRANSRRVARLNWRLAWRPYSRRAARR